MYRSDLPPFILDFPWRKFRSRKGTPFRDYFASTIRDNLTKELRNSFRGTSAPEETATAFFFHGHICIEHARFLPLPTWTYYARSSPDRGYLNWLTEISATESRLFG